MPRWDHQSSVCFVTAEGSARTLEEMDANPPQCHGLKMKRLPSKVAFSISGFNAANGYAKGSAAEPQAQGDGIPPESIVPPKPE